MKELVRRLCRRLIKIAVYINNNRNNRQTTKDKMRITLPLSGMKRFAEEEYFLLITSVSAY
jgi:hypothetical protein